MTHASSNFRSRLPPSSVLACALSAMVCVEQWLLPEYLFSGARLLNRRAVRGERGQKWSSRGVCNEVRSRSSVSLAVSERRRELSKILTSSRTSYVRFSVSIYQQVVVSTSIILHCLRTGKTGTHLKSSAQIAANWQTSIQRIFLFQSNQVAKNRPLRLVCAQRNVSGLRSAHHHHFASIKTALFFSGSLALVPLTKSKMGDVKGVTEATFKDADKLFDDSNFDDLYKLLTSQPDWENNEQVLWRVARCEFQQAKNIKEDKVKKEELINKAYEHVKKSLALDDKNGMAHKWAAILLDAVSTLKGTKERVLQVLNVRNHMEKAIEYAPDDATSFYLLGEWHFSCYQVSWWERKIASIAFGKLPDADMEVACKMFEKAEEIEKDFYSKNKLMLAKTLLELKRDKERAIELLKEVVNKYSSSEKWDDKEACEEATKLLSQHK